jgi:cellulose synthase/poly-beta-1,6-N-acetylglucosamine synthase-like glycosyltransferase
MDSGTIAPRTMLGALAEADRTGQPLARVVAAEALVPREDLLIALAQHYSAMVINRAETPGDAGLARALPADFCLKHAVLPWMRLGDTLVLATSRPEQFSNLLTQLPDDIGPVLMALVTEQDLHDEIAARHGDALADAAEKSLPAEDSCRDLNQATTFSTALAILAAGCGITALIFVPRLFFAVALALAMTSLLVSQFLKLAAFIAVPRRRELPTPKRRKAPPRVSLLIPLYREEEIASTLVTRMQRIDYPKTLLEVYLVLEANDTQTRDTLAKTQLPPWIKTITVPPGEVTTKPRALNYAYRFTSGDYIGIYDAEDAPAPDQIDRMVEHFENAPPEVGCVQGILDFYNPRANWLSRCFTIEYASWFRILLPGLSRMGLPVPLGGTTVFFRREALEASGGWDAYNVTEDADLGMRLARRGYRTELMASVTREEANNRFWPWIKQRSRWLKGYVITWWVHSRRPVRLWKDLGAKQFFGMQALFLSTILQFTLAPVLWSFWLVLAGLPHPLDPYLTQDTILLLTATFLSAEAISLVLGVAALARSPHRDLIPWVPTLFVYFPLGSAAIYKAISELFHNPFYWDKTIHGHSSPDSPEAETSSETKL